MITKIRKIYMLIIFFVLIFFVSGCFVNTMIPAPKRPFASDELLANKEELPIGWTIPWGPQRDTDTSKPQGAMQVNLFKKPNSEKPDVTERVAIYPSVEGAKIQFSEQAKFPENTDVQGWSYTSKIADEQKFSCFTYSNLDYPICTWLARYQEITIEIIGRLMPGRATIDEMQVIVKIIDNKVANHLTIFPTKSKN